MRMIPEKLLKKYVVFLTIPKDLEIAKNPILSRTFPNCVGI